MRYLLLPLVVLLGCDTPGSRSASVSTCSGDIIYDTVDECLAGYESEGIDCLDPSFATVDWPNCAAAADAFKCPWSMPDRFAWHDDVLVKCAP